MLSAHYRSPINFSHDLMKSAAAGLERIYTCVSNLEFVGANTVRPHNNAQSETEYINKLAELKQKYLSAMDDDLNTADAIAAVFEIVSLANKTKTVDSNISKEAIDYTVSLIKELCGVLGLLTKNKEEPLPEEVKSLLAERTIARANKDWIKSDEIRDKLQSMGYAVEDTKQGAKVKKYHV